MPKNAEIHSGLCRQKNRQCFIAIFGIVLAIFGFLNGIFWEQLFNCFLSQKMVITNDSEVYENWKSPPFDLSIDIYLFNWTNPSDFSNMSSKPILQQLGPYRFTERPTKVDIVWHAENASVTYRKKSDFFFDSKNSNGSLEDEVITLNPVALSAAAKAKQWNMVKRKMVNVGLNVYSQEMSVRKTVDELLFTGYHDDMIDVARSVPLFGNDIEVPFDKFGWFYTRNGSADLTGIFTVHTGADDIMKRGQMYSWNYKNRTQFFESYCGYTNGSAGEFQPPSLQKHGSVALFTPDMCRTIPLDYTNTIEIEGVLGYKYAGGLRSVDNGSLYTDNACFCGGVCTPSGVMNISACRYGSPVFMSYPHFYNADSYYVNQVEGLQPNQQDHEFYMILEPNTGIALEVAARFQVNMLVEPIMGIKLYQNIPRIFFPLIWFEQKVRIPKDLANNLKVIPYILLGGQIFAGVCFAAGIILIFWYLYSCRKASLNIKQRSQVANLDTSEIVKQFPDKSPLLEKSTVFQVPLNKGSNTSESIDTNTTKLS